MNSSDTNPDEPEADPRLRDCLRSMPTPVTPSTLESRVHHRIRRRRVERVAVASGSVLALAGSLWIWQSLQTPAPGVLEQPVPEVVQNPLAPPSEIPSDELAVLFAPPPVDPLTIVGKRNEGWVAALNRLEDTK